MSDPWFFNTLQIKRRDRLKIVSLKTGFTELDKKIIGLNKGEVTCISGLNGSGKSSILSQIALDVVEAGKRIALFSGELTEDRVLDWLQLQAAGRDNTIKTDYENYFYVRDGIKDRINGWLYQKLFVYNNAYGNSTDEIISGIDYCIGEKKIDMVVLDNLMSINLGSAYDKNEKQSVFIKEIKKFAVDKDVHIVLVAHPRKSLGFLRKDDIAGTADLTNMVDNVFIVHRVNEDFKRLSKQTFGWNVNNPIYDFSNVIEVCKNRDFGVQDFFVGLYYEKESKRFKNTLAESRAYGWEYEETT